MWTPRHHLGELERLFVDVERRFAFLQDIDNTIVNSKDCLSAKLSSLIRKFSLQIIHADAFAICFPATEGYIVSLFEETIPSDDKIISDIGHIIPRNLEPGKVLFRKISRKVRPDTAALLLPVGTAANQLFCVIAILTTKISPSVSPLNDDGVIQYAARVLTQLTVLVESELGVRRSSLQNNFIKSFFDARSDQAKTLTNCLKAIRNFLPDWEISEGCSESMRRDINDKILVQFLVFNGINQPLTIQAQLQANTKDSENLPVNIKDTMDRDVGKPVLIDDSVCGTLVNDFLSDHSNRVKNVDPSRPPYRTLYKSFFGQEIPQSELIATVATRGEADGEQLIGLLNLEHCARHRFSPSETPSY